ncbi:MAG: MFS transporter [Proteobacteria bacterium]|nr:MFS transporter [Pseudomonadota bacterium]
MKFSGRLSALHRVQYRRYWLGSFASVGATQLQIMAQGWLVFKLSGSALMLGYLGAATAIPAIVLSLFGGALADQLNKKTVLMVTSLAVALLLLTLAIADVAHLATAWLVIMIAALVSIVSGLDWPTRQSIFPMLIEREDMMSAVALNSIIWQGCRMMMPALGGILIAYTGTWFIFFLCAAGFFTMFLVISSLNIQTTTSSGVPAFASTMQKVAEGLSFILTNKTFLLLISLSYGGMFFVSSYMQLMPAFSSLLQAGETGYGYLISITGVGSVIGTIIVGSFQQSHRLGRIILAAAFLSGSSVYLFTAATGYALETGFAFPLAMAAGFTIAMFSSIFMITSMTVLQLQVPDKLRGRVMGLHGITYSLMPLGGLLAGFMSTLISAPAAIALNATVYLVIVAIISISQVQIRRIDGSAMSPAG